MEVKILDSARTKTRKFFKFKKGEDFNRRNT